MSTRRPRKWTPSASRRKRCSKAECPRSLISPPEPRTRCQGTPTAPRSAAAVCRAPRGKPAAAAIAPYVETMPRGIWRMAARILVRLLAVRVSRFAFFRVAIQTISVDATGVLGPLLRSGSFRENLAEEPGQCKSRPKYSGRSFGQRRPQDDRFNIYC
jgi:hypothetical protein